MAATHTRHEAQAGFSQLLVLAVALWSVPAAGFAAQDFPAHEPPAPVRVRTVSPAASALLERGLLVAPTIRTLVATLERSDVFVYIETAVTRRVPGLKCLRGETRFVASTPGGRYLRIIITFPNAASTLLTTLGHELQHAVEIAGVPDINGESDCVRYYRQYGISVGGEARCTLAAREAGARVLAEIREATPAR